MGTGFKMGGSGYFKATLNITTNPTATVTITMDTTTQTKQADASGKVTFIIRKRGTYTITTDYGASEQLLIKEYKTYTLDAAFAVNVTVQANNSATITLTNYDGSVKYSAVANPANGLCKITVRKAGNYTVSSSNSGSNACEGNNDSIEVSQNRAALKIQYVKMNIASTVGSGLYQSQTLLCYWGKPSDNWTGVHVRRNTGSAPTSRTSGTSVYTGAGNGPYQLNTSINAYGVLDSNLTDGTTYYYSIFSYITINNINFWAQAYRTTSYTAKKTNGNVIKITSSGDITIPAGWRSFKYFVVGGGASGATGCYLSSGGSSNYYYTYGGAGGGSGYTKSGNLSVLPGKKLTVEIGNGGASRPYTSGSGSFSGYAGYAGSPSKLYYPQGTLVAQADGGDAPPRADSSMEANGGSGGGAGARRYYANRSFTAYAGNGGSNGGNGGSAINTGVSSGEVWRKGGTGQGTTTVFNGVTYAGGGGGGGEGTSGAYYRGTGGSGGGGNGASSSSELGGSGSANTGSGGGGGWHRGGTGAGGSGVILLQCTS